MNWLLKFMFGPMCIVMDTTDGEGSDLGGGNENSGDDQHQTDAGGEQQQHDAGTGEQKKDEPPKPVTAEAMADAIGKGLKGEEVPDPKKPVVEKKELTAEQKQQAADEAAAKTLSDQEAATAKKATEAKAATDALSKKKPDDPDLKLTDDERKVLSPKAQARFVKLTEYAKLQHERAESVAVTNGQLMQARNDIMGLLDDSKTEPQELTQLLNFNFLVKTGKFDDAIKVLEEQRLMLYKQAGREAPGVDLLTDYPDIKARVDANELSRADAVELVNAAELKKRTEHQTQQQQQREQQDNDADTKAQTALSDITAFQKEMSAKDLDYKAKEARLIPQIDAIIRDYQPHQWLPTIKRLYSTITVVKSTMPSGNNPLRPSGQSGGTKAPNNMLDAVAGGLGYATSGQ